jgi:hypothetical protein
MADNVTSQTILDGERLFIAKYTNISDGTGETAVVKVDVSTLNPNIFGYACNGVKINKIWMAAHGMEVRILWDADVNLLAWQVTSNGPYLMDFSSFPLQMLSWPSQDFPITPSDTTFLATTADSLMSKARAL